MSHRPEQASSIIHKAVQSVLSEGLHDPRLAETMITITQVKVTVDLRTAVIHVSIHPEKKEKLAMHALAAAARHIRRRVGDLVALHQAPELIFKLDKGAKRQAAVLEALAMVRAEDERKTDAAQGSEKTPPPLQDSEEGS